MEKVVEHIQRVESLMSLYHFLYAFLVTLHYQTLHLFSR